MILEGEIRMRTDFRVNQTPQLSLFSEDQISELHLATVEVLKRTGVEVFNEEALSLLRDNSCSIKGNRVRIPSSLVEESLQAAPKRVSLSTRDGKNFLQLEDDKFYFGTGSDCPHILDSFTGKRRKFLKKDGERGALICDYLPNIDFVMSMGLVSDVLPSISDRHQFAAMLTNTNKSIVFTCHDKEGLSDILDMCIAVRGSLKEFRKSPFIALYTEPITPLKHPNSSLEKLLFAAEKGIPLIYTPAPMAGATAPVTLAGTIVTGNAELLSGLIITQLKNKGAPFIYGGVFTIMDMSTSIFSYAAPEFYLLNMALADMAHYYKLPVFSTAGCSDAKTLDQQAGIEAGISCLISALSGANLIHDVGYLNYGLTASYEMLVMSDEIISMVKRIMKGIKIDKENLALNIINQIGPGGNFLTTEHTLNHFREELWSPTLLNRKTYQDWEKEGKKTLADRCNEKVKHILKNHSVEPLESAVQQEIERILTGIEIQ